jgi:hypothetical protein
MSNFVPTTNLAANKALVIDTTSPTISTLSPADNATGVSATANLVLTFDAAVTVGSGNVSIRLASDGSTVEAIAVGSGQVTGSGTSIITVDPSVTLSASTAYYIHVAGAAFDDVAGNSFAGITDTTTWSFTTADTTAPTITDVSSSAANGSYNAGDIIDIDVTFSEAVTSTGNVTVTLETGTTDRTCTFTVSNATTGTCDYTVQAGDTSSDLTTNSISGTIADQSSNAMSNFTPTTNLAANKALVIDTTNPTISTLSPTDGATDVSVGANLVLTFDAAVVVGTGNVTIKLGSDNSTVEAIAVTGGQVTGTGTTAITVNPTSNLSSLTDYYVQVDATAFDDVAGNSYAGISDTTSWNFTTDVDVTNPSVSSFSPADGASNATLSMNLIITFDETVDVETGNITLKKGSDDSTVETIDVTSGQVTGTGTETITINPSADLLYSAGYYIQIDATAFDDPSGNSYAGISDSTTWNFTTVAESVPDEEEEPDDLEISDVEYDATETTITIKWKTNNDADSSVRYGTDRNMKQKKTDSHNEKKHETTLKDLTPGTRYYFRINSEDENESDDSSKIYSVTTEKKTETATSDSDSVETDPVFLPAPEVDVPETTPTVPQTEPKKDTPASPSSSDTEPLVTQYVTEVFTEDGIQYIKEVKFQILDTNGDPLSYTAVTLYSEPRTAMTNDQGVVTFDNVPTGKHQLVFISSGEEITKDIEIPALDQEDGPIQGEVIVITAEKDPLPLWIWGAGALLGMGVILLIVLVYRRNKGF